MANNLLAQDRGELTNCNKVDVGCILKGEKVFETKKEYRQNQDFIPGCAASIGDIDFDNYSLVGVGYVSQSRPIMKCNIVYNEQLNTYNHNTIITVYGVDKNGVHLSHWCLIPKLEEDQKVVFKKEEYTKNLEDYPVVTE